jgi:hypothetical protein
MENISHNLSTESIEKELPQKVIHFFLMGEVDFSEYLKFELLLSIDKNST